VVRGLVAFVVGGTLRSMISRSPGSSAQASPYERRLSLPHKAGNFRPQASSLRRLRPVLTDLAKGYLKRKSSPAPVRHAAERLLASPLAVAHSSSERAHGEVL